MDKRAPRLGRKATGLGRQYAVWLTTTALTAILLSPGVLYAQTIAPTTTPQGGEVVGGNATITQSTGSTIINQTSQRTAINWQSFNVGSASTVQFNQPSSTAIAVNQVVSANPSIIAGRITANGQIVLVNQSGVVFTHGSQVNAESIVVATSSVATKDFMAGRLVFSGAPNLGAKIVNDGQLTARQAGLVGLVAPQVINNGVITARLGQVILAGASAFTLDLYGDKLVSLDVTQAVRAVDVGGKLIPALVTNNGVIIADGGTITLTAQDADALVTQLVNAGGTIRANTVGGKTGSIAIEGVGGDIQIAGNLLAQGGQAGSNGGAIEALTTGTVNVASTAVIDASGSAGGGVVALGTDIARADAGATDTTAPRAAVVHVASGAQIKANATGTGNGGKVVLLSAHETDFGGTIAVGGAVHGTGGLAEISSDNVISLSGTVYDTSIDGRAGEILLDPGTLIVGTGGTAATGTGTSTTIGGLTGTNSVAEVDPASLVSLSGTIVLEANNLLSVANAINLTGASALTLLSDGDVTIGASIDTIGSLEIDATGSLAVNAGLTATSIAVSDAGGGSIGLGGAIVATQLTLQSGGGVTETTGGVIDVGTLDSASLIDNNLKLGNVNTITTLGTVAVLGSILLNNSGSLDIAGPVSTPDSLTLEDNAGVSESTGGIIEAATFGSGGTTIGGDVLLQNSNSINVVNGLTLSGTSTLSLADTASLDVTGAVSAGAATISATALTFAAPVSVGNELVLAAFGGITEATGGVIDAATLTGTGGTLSLGKANDIGTLDGLTAAGNILFNDTAALEIAGLISTSGVLTLEGAGASEMTGGTIDAATLTSGGTTIGGNISLVNENDIGTLSGLVLGSGDALVLTDTNSLNVTGAVDAGTATISVAGLTLAAPVSVANALVLESSGAVTEASGGVIDAATLSSGGTTIGGAVSLGKANNIGTLGGLALASGFGLVLTDTGALDVTGALDADSATLNTAGLTLAAPVSVASTLVLESSGGVTEASGGVIDAPTLNSGGTSIGGTVALGNANDIGTLGGFGAAGNILLNDIAALQIAGLVSTSGGFTLEGGGVSELTGGVIDAATLSSGGTTLGGDASLANANDIGTLDGFTLGSASALTLNDTAALTLGSVTAGGATVSAAALTLTAPVSVTNALVLESAGSIRETAGGTISAATLTSNGTTIGGGVTLGNANTIGTLDNFAAAGNILLNDAALQLAGQLSTPGMLMLEGGGVEEITGGVIDAATLSSGGTSIGGDASLDNANDIGNLDEFTLGGASALTLTDTDVLNLASFTAGAATISAGGMTLSGPVSIVNALVLKSGTGITEAGGGISAATLSSGGSTIGGAASLTDSNTIGSLDGFATSGDFVLDNAGSLTIAAPLQANDVTLADNGTVTLDAFVQASGGQATLIADGLLEGTGGAVSVDSGGNIAIAPFTKGRTVDLGGTAQAGLQLSNAFLAGLDPAANLSIGQAGSNEAGSIFTEGVLSLGNPALALRASGQITQTGVLSSADAVTLSGSSLALDGDLTATTLHLVSSGGITQPGSAVLGVGTLDSGGTTIGGAVALDGTDNAIATLAGFAATGGFTLNDAAALVVSGPVTAADIALTDGSSNASSLALGNTLQAASGGTISLVADTISAAGAGISAPGGTVAISPYTNGRAIDIGGTAAGLDLSSGLISDISAATSLVQISTSGSITADGSVSLAPGTLSLNGNGVVFNGVLTVPQLLALTSGNGITETAAAQLTAGTLLAACAISGPADFALGDNHIDTLGAFSLSGSNDDLTLNDAASLQLTGKVTAQNVTLSADGLTIANVISAGTAVTLASTSGVVENGGAIDAPSLTSGGTTIAGGAQLGGANSIGVLNGFAATGNVLVNDTAALNVIGNLTGTNITLAASGLSLAGDVTTPGLLALASSGNVTQGAGSISAATLSSDGGTIGGAVNLAQAGNAVQTLAGFAATGSLVLATSGLLDVTGPVTASDIALDAAGIGLNGAVSTGQLQLASSAGVTEGAGGQVTASTLTTGGATVTGDIVLNNAGNQIDTLGAVNATGGLTLNDAAALSLTAPVTLGGTLALLDAASITQTGGGISAVALTSDGGTIGGDASFGGGINAIATLGDFAARGNVLVTDTAPLALQGNISTGDILSLDSNGAITQGSGIISTALLNADAASISMPSANQIGALGVVTAGNVGIAGLSSISGQLTADNASLSTGGDFTFDGNAQISNALNVNAGGNITQNSGNVSAQTATLDSRGNIVLSGDMGIAGDLDLIAAGNITHAQGVLDAGTLTGSADTQASFAASTDFGTLGSFIMQDSLFLLNNAGALTIVGPVVANVVRVTADGIVTLEGSTTGGLFITGVVEPSTTTPNATDSVISSTAGPNGPSIVVNGDFQVNTGPYAQSYLGNAAQPATVFLDTLPNGTMNFGANGNGVLDGPSVGFELAAGPNGTVTGNLDAKHLEILSALSTDLNGAINGIGGTTAAGNGDAFPFPQPALRFNACPIGSVNCTILPTEALPAGNPLEKFDISSRKRKRLDHNVVLPGIATRDF